MSKCKIGCDAEVQGASEFCKSCNKLRAEVMKNRMATSNEAKVRHKVHDGRERKGMGPGK